MEAQEIISEKEFFKKHQETIDTAFKKINALKIPIIKCDEITPKGFILEIKDISDIDNYLLTEGSICAYNIEIFNNEGSDFPDFYNGIERCIHSYIRLGTTETWIYSRNPTFIGATIDIYEKFSDYDDEEYEEGAEDIDYERLNRLSTIVAKSKGFNLLKNRDQRKNFAKEVLVDIDEDVMDHEYYGIASNAETFYDFGVLPLEVKKLIDEGKSEKEIAITLGHTKAKISKALLVDIPDVIRKNIEEYEENNS